jgi:hypothetical protein
MSDSAFIAIAEDGHLTLFWGDGTEEQKHVILRGPRVAHGRDLIEAIEDLKAWAEAQGYTVIVPSYDLEVPDVEIDVPSDEVEDLDIDEIENLLDDIYYAGDTYNDYDEYDDEY